MISLYEFKLSGNCHKVRPMLSLLGLPYKSILVDSAHQAHKSPEFPGMNPFGQVPVLTDGAVVLRDSQAIIFYLARAYGKESWLPDDPVTAAQIVAWLATAANEVWQGPAALRLDHKFSMPIDEAASRTITANLCHILDEHLSAQPWLVSPLPTIADVAMYPYLALAPEGRWDLGPYPNLCAWLGRIRKLPGYIDMPGTWQ